MLIEQFSWKLIMTVQSYSPGLVPSDLNLLLHIKRKLEVIRFGCYDDVKNAEKLWLPSFSLR